MCKYIPTCILYFRFSLPPIFDTLVGGVFAIRTEHFQDVNGYSNSYWGWGAEDDDMSARYKRHVVLGGTMLTSHVKVRTLNRDNGIIHVFMH